MLVLIVSVCYSEEPLLIKSVPDTLVPIPINDLRNAMRMRDSCLVMKEELGTTKDKLSVVERALATADKINKENESLDVVNKRIIKNLDTQNSKQGMQIIMLAALNTGLRVQVKRKNWTIVKVGGVSVSVIGTLAYLLIKK